MKTEIAEILYHTIKGEKIDGRTMDEATVKIAELVEREMILFAEWTGKERWNWNKSNLWFKSSDYAFKTTQTLLELFNNLKRKV